MTTPTQEQVERLQKFMDWLKTNPNLEDVIDEKALKMAMGNLSNEERRVVRQLIDAGTMASKPMTVRGKPDAATVKALQGGGGLIAKIENDLLLAGCAAVKTTRHEDGTVTRERIDPRSICPPDVPGFRKPAGYDAEYLRQIELVKNECPHCRWLGGDHAVNCMQARQRTSAERSRYPFVEATDAGLTYVHAGDCAVSNLFSEPACNCPVRCIRFLDEMGVTQSIEFGTTLVVVRRVTDDNSNAHFAHIVDPSSDARWTELPRNQLLDDVLLPLQRAQNTIKRLGIEEVADAPVRDEDFDEVEDPRPFDAQRPKPAFPGWNAYYDHVMFEARERRMAANRFDHDDLNGYASQDDWDRAANEVSAKHERDQAFNRAMSLPIDRPVMVGHGPKPGMERDPK